MTNAYNNQGLLQSMSSNDSIPASISTVSYNAASQITLLPFGNGATTNYTYDAQDQRLTDIVTTKSGTTLLNVHYTYDNAGNVMSAQDNVGSAGTTNYGYDDLNRLLSASVTSGPNQYSRSWTYYENGNTKTRVEQGVTTNYTYDTNHKHAVAQAGTGKYFCYDANGNMTRRNATTSGCTDGDAMSYDVENRMTSMVTGSGTTSFAYNGDGARVSRTVSTGTTYYIGNYYEIWKPAGSATFNKYYYFGASRVATRINGTLFYMQGDHLGSSSLLMTTDGTLQTRQTYFPYGAKRVADGSALPAGMDTTFTGQKSDDSTGLMYYGARYYDMTLGRFTKADTIVPNPMDPQSLNRYSYVRNNPVNLVDPTGHTDCQSQDTWCWENQYYTAQGLCYSEKTQDWTRTCKPEADSAEIVEEVYHVNLEGGWGGRELDILLQALYKVSSAMLGGFFSAFGGTTFYLEDEQLNKANRYGHACPLQGTLPGCAPGVHVYKGLFSANDSYGVYYIIHEMGHVWDARAGGALSRGMASSAGTIKNWVGQGELPPGDLNAAYALQFGNLPFVEDWAESFAAFMYPEYFNSVGWRGLGPLRDAYISLQVEYWIANGEDPYSDSVVGVP